MEINAETPQVHLQQEKGELSGLFNQETADIPPQDEYKGQEPGIVKAYKFHHTGIGTLTN